MQQKQMEDKVYFVELDEKIPFLTYEHLLQLLSTEKRERIWKYHFDLDKKLSVVSDLLVRYLACNYLDVHNSKLRFEMNEYGKPFLAGIPDFHYNISHTRNAIAVAVSRNPVGVDVEKIREYEGGIVSRFFCQKEKIYIENDNENASRRFYEVWTKKEAYVKWAGKGLSIPLNSFDVFDDKLSCCFETFENRNYMISICKEDHIHVDFYYDIDEGSLYEKFNNLQ